MPHVTVEVRMQYTPEDEIRLLEEIHEALCETFEVAPGARCERLIAHASHRFTCPVSKSHPEKWTVITVESFPGRSTDSKRALYKSMVARLQSFGIPPDHVAIVLHEIPRENWGLRGGLAACDF